MAAGSSRVGSVDDLLANSLADTRDERAPWLLAPCDLQAVKASGVTFVASLLERVIEEQARGDAAKADGLRTSIRRSSAAASTTSARDRRRPCA